MINVRKQGVPRGLTRQLVKLATPIVLSNLAYTLLGAADTLFMGRVSITALGAVGLGSITFLTALLVLRGTISGTTPFVARMYGAGDLPAAGRFLQHFITLALLISPSALILPWVFKGYFLLIRPDPVIAVEAMVYMNIRLVEVPFSLVAAALSGFLVGIGNTRLPMILATITVLFNIAANYVLVFGKLGLPAMGLAGAAWGSVLAVMVQAVLLLLVVFIRYSYHYHLTAWSLPGLADVGKMVKVGFPIGVADSIEVGSFSIFLALISKLGTVELAASQIANQVSALAFMPGFALGVATGSLVGRYLGADQPQVAQAVGYRGAALGVGVMGCLGLIFLVFPRELAGLFTKDPAVVGLSVILLRLMALYQIFDALNIVFRGVLNGAGDTRYTMMVTLLAAWGVFLPGVYLGAFVLDWGAVGAWIGAIGYLFLLGTAFSIRFYRGRWKTILLG